MRNIFILYLVITVSALSQIHYVSKTGSSTPPYLTWETAADSIMKAIEVAENGDTVFIANGVYKENLTVDRQLYIIGESSDSTVIDGRGLDSLTIMIKQNSYLQNLHVFGEKFTWEPYNAILFCTADTLFIRNCILDSAYCGVGAIGNITTESSIIKNCEQGYDLANLDEVGTLKIKNSGVYLLLQGDAISPGP